MSDMAFLYGTGTYIQCLVIIYNGKSSEKAYVTESFCCTPKQTLQLKNSIPLSTLLTLALLPSLCPMSLSAADILLLLWHRLYLCCEGSRLVLKAEETMWCKKLANPGGGKSSVSIRGVSCQDPRTTDVHARVDPCKGRS